MNEWTKEQLAAWDTDHAAALGIVARYCERMGYGKATPCEIWRGRAFMTAYFCFFDTEKNHIIKVARDDRSYLATRQAGPQLYMQDIEIIDGRLNRYGWPMKTKSRRAKKSEW